jgi:protein-S-isoprenylcysteine O-methyltransferase Ste14
LGRHRLAPLIGTIGFLLIAPGSVAGLAPWALSQWQMNRPFFGIGALRWVGAALIVTGAATVLDSFARFALEGLGTPAPVYPTNRLIISGLYRNVRNPMYLGVIVLILGQALVLGDSLVAVYGAVVWLGFDLFVRAYEEPKLQRRYGPEFARYRAHVPRWLPRVAPWRDDSPAPGVMG